MNKKENIQKKTIWNRSRILIALFWILIRWKIFKLINIEIERNNEKCNLIKQRKTKLSFVHHWIVKKLK